MLVLNADSKFESDLKAYQKPDSFAAFEEMYNTYSQKTIEQLMSLRQEELTRLLDFLADLDQMAVSEDLFWKTQYMIPGNLRKMKSKRTERRLF